MTALKVVATDTASGPTSNLLELWAGSTPILRFNVAKNGTVAFRSGNVFGDIATDGVGRVLLNASTAAGARVTGDLHIGSNDTVLVRDAANTLALRNSTSPQTFNVYGTWTTAITNFERLAIKYNATDVAYQIAAEKGSTNGDYRPLQIWTGGAKRLIISAAGAVIERPLSSVTPSDNGDLVVEATSNTTLTFKLKGTDGTVRSGTITLSV